ncbi:phage major tail tube protein [Pseudomonas fluorescens]
MIPEVLVNTNLFVDGMSFTGDVPSMTLPKIVVKTDEFRAGGMGGAIEMDMGLEKMEAGFVTTGVRRESMKFLGLADQTACNAVFRGAFKGQKGRITPVVATVRGMLKELDMGDWKAGDKAELKHSIAVTYYKLEIDGRVMYEIDPMACVRIINGVDQNAAIRTALAL